MHEFWIENSQQFVEKHCGFRFIVIPVMRKLHSLPVFDVITHAVVF